MKGMAFARKIHGMVPPNWYYRSIKENLLQRYWHTRRFSEVTELIVETKDGIALDIGSADGVFTEVVLLKSKVAKIYGIDILAASVLWANRHWHDNRMNFSVGDAHKLKFPPKTFDLVLALEVLEHVEDPKKVLKEIHRVLKNEGYAIFLVPTDSILFRIVWTLWTKWRGKIWKDAHIQTYRDDYLLKLAGRLGFKVSNNKKFILGMLQAVKVIKN